MTYTWISIVALFVFNTSFSQDNTPEMLIKNPRHKQDEASVFKCHPNPAESDLFIIGTHKIESIEIIDVFGTRVAFYQFDKSIIRIDVSEIKSGIYLLKVIDEKGKQDIKKLVVR